MLRFVQIFVQGVGGVDGLVGLGGIFSLSRFSNLHTRIGKKTTYRPLEYDSHAAGVLFITQSVLIH